LTCADGGLWRSSQWDEPVLDEELHIARDPSNLLGQNLFGASQSVPTRV
jgi:hypothetical protein